MAIRRKGSAWQVDVTWKGRRAPRVSRPTEAEARALEAEFKAALMAGREIVLEEVQQQSRRDMLTSDLRFLGTLFERTFSLYWKGTANERQAEINGRMWVEALGHLFDVTTLTTEKIEEVCNMWSDKGNAPGTINRKLMALRKMLGLAHHEQILPRVPILPMRKEYAGRIRYYSDAEEASMLAFFEETGENELRDMIVLGVDTGFRKGELMQLEVRDFIPETGLLHVWKTKSDAPRAVPLTERAREVFLQRAQKRSPGDRIFSDRLTPGKAEEILQLRQKHCREMISLINRGTRDGA